MVNRRAIELFEELPGYKVARTLLFSCFFLSIPQTMTGSRKKKDATKPQAEIRSKEQNQKLGIVSSDEDNEVWTPSINIFRLRRPQAKSSSGTKTKLPT